MSAQYVKTRARRGPSVKCPSNVRQMSVKTRQNTSKHVKCPARPSVKPHPDPSNPTVPPGPPSNPALRSHDYVSPLPSPPLARPVGRLTVGFTLPARVARGLPRSLLSKSRGGAALRQSAPAQRALRQTRQSPAARRALRQTRHVMRQMPVKHGPRAGPYSPRPP